jgi:uncharacterized protein YbaA (DUF1428 family)
MGYVDGFIIPVPPANREAYREMADRMAVLWLENGAERVVECWGDDVAHGKVTDFYRAVKAEEGENVVFSWVYWPSRTVRDEGNERIMNDPRMSAVAMPFDGMRLVSGGFQVILDRTA